MRNPMTKPKWANWTFGAALATLLLAATPARPAASGDITAAATPAADSGEMLELGEIWVRGRKLSVVIENAEADFFRLFNKINKARDYDITCGDLRPERDSPAMTRVCVPEFIGRVYNATYVPQAATSMCLGHSWSFGSQGMSCQTGIHQRGGNPIIVGPMVRDEASFREQKLEMQRNFMRVVYSDQQLLDKATKLAGLYAELAAVRTSYTAASAADEDRSANKRRPRP